ncbi:MAG TPA: DoxX family protein [Casimicrobiaceae bacterium]|nr:DoxX family protein [Casimicrobiaceae bacterium]
MPGVGQRAFAFEKECIVENDLLILVERVMLTALFVMTGWQKLTGFAGTVDYMKTSGVPSPALAAIVATVVEFFFGIGIILGIYTRVLAWIFVAFTLATALLGHRFWTMQGEKRHENFLNFFKNVSIAGGLVLLALVGPGRYALIGG